MASITRASVTEDDALPSDVFAGWDSNVDVKAFNKVVSETYASSAKSASVGHPPADEDLKKKKSEEDNAKPESVFFGWETSDKEFQDSAVKINVKPSESAEKYKTSPANLKRVVLEETEPRSPQTPEWKRDLKQNRKGREQEFD